MYTIRAIWEGELVDTDQSSDESDAWDLFNTTVEHWKNSEGVTVQLIHGDDVLAEDHNA